MLPLLRNALFAAFAGSIAAAVGAKTLALSDYQDWSNGTAAGTNLTQLYGSVALASRLGISGDQFDQPFVKSFWKTDARSASAYAGDAWTVLSGAGSGLGFESAAVPVDGSVNQIYATINALSPIGTGSLVLDGTTWGGNYVSIEITRTASLLLPMAHTSIGVDVSSINFGSNLGPVSVCLSFTAAATSSVVSAYYLTTYTAQWTPLTPAAGVWQLITTTTLALSPVDYVIGLGSPPGATGSGSATYSNFQVLPYVSQGTWLSAPLDWGGTPQQAGSIHWDATVPALTALQIQTRSSADGVAWSAFSPPCVNGDPTTHAPARYVQVLATLSASDPSGNSTPVLHRLQLDQPELGGGPLLKPADVRILPNPVKSDHAHIQWLLSVPARAVALEFSGPGRRNLLQVQGGASAGLNSYDLDCSRLANDVYFLRLRAVGFDGVECDSVKKLVLSR